MKERFPFITPTLAAQLESSIAFFSLEKQKALSLLPNNPYGIQLRPFGNATAFLAQKTSSVAFNRVYGMHDEDLSYLDEILTWYRRYNGSCCFEVVPHFASPILLWHFAKAGLYQSGFYNVLYGPPQEDISPLPPNVTIHSVLPEEKDLFAAIYFESFGVQKTTTSLYMWESIRAIVDIPSNHCFFALIDTRIVAIAVLSLYQQVGYLALAATLPSFRGYGCHKALLQTRIQRATSLGCQMIVGQAGVGTISQYNMERVGLRLAYTKVDWVPYDEQQEMTDFFDPFNQ